MTRGSFKCKACGCNFTTTSGTAFASRKLSYRQLVAAIQMGGKMTGAVLSEMIGVNPRTAWSLNHTLRQGETFP